MLYSSPLLIITYAVLFGTTMKIADLLDEHGLKWFKGSAILFGFLWGIFGALMMLGNPIVANIYLSLILAFVLRYRIDYINHGIAATIMFLTFFATQTVDWNVFLGFFLFFAIFGLMTDYFEGKKHSSGFIVITLHQFIDLRFQYYLFPFIYSVYTGVWLVFFTVAANMLFYELTLRYGPNIMKNLGAISIKTS